jgi:hypothetical protein
MKQGKTLKTTTIIGKVYKKEVTVHWFADTELNIFTKQYENVNGESIFKEYKSYKAIKTAYNRAK